MGELTSDNSTQNKIWSIMEYLSKAFEDKLNQLSNMDNRDYNQFVNDLTQSESHTQSENLVQDVESTIHTIKNNSLNKDLDVEKLCP